MATQPDQPTPAPDRIEPAAPPEQPITPGPAETPITEPPEFTPDGGDMIEPGRGPDELPLQGV